METNNTEAIAKKIFGLMNQKKDVDYTDPDFEMIQTHIQKIPEMRIKDFYMSLMDREESFTSTGFFKRNTLKSAINEFMEVLSSEVWREQNVSQKSEKLEEKINSVYLNTKEKTNEYQSRFYDNVKIDRIEYITKDGEKKPLFNEDELEVIRIAGFKSLINKCSMHSHREVVEVIEKHYKTMLTAKFFKEDRAENEAELLIRIPEPKRF